LCTIHHTHFLPLSTNLARLYKESGIIPCLSLALRNAHLFKLNWTSASTVLLFWITTPGGRKWCWTGSCCVAGKTERKKKRGEKTGVETGCGCRESNLGLLHQRRRCNLNDYSCVPYTTPTLCAYLRTWVRHPQKVGILSELKSALAIQIIPSNSDSNSNVNTLSNILQHPIEAHLHNLL
jgi:hypothetical protein